MSDDFNPISREAVITNQPASGVNDSRIESSENNRLLRYLSAVDKLIVCQKVLTYEGWTNCGYKNSYTIKDSIGRDVYKAIESSNCCIRNLCYQKRPLGLKIVDEYQTEVIHLYRGLRCQGCCFPCCLQRLEIYSPPNHLLGIVQQEWSLFFPDLSVQTADGETLYKIGGPVCTWSCCNNSDFPVLDAKNGVDVSKITKKCSGLMEEALLDDSQFGLTFLTELEVNQKAMLLGALFLIDFMYYESYFSRACNDMICCD